MDYQSISNYEFKFNRRLYQHWRKKSIRYLRWVHIKTTGLETINKEKGPAVIAANHMSWQDILFIGAMIQQPVSFAASTKIPARIPVIIRAMAVPPMATVVFLLNP